MDKQEQQFIRGFNHGYLLARYLPDLMAKIVKGINSTSDYFHGFFSGEKEWELENSRIQLDDLKHIRTESKSRERNIERDE